MQVVRTFFGSDDSRPTTDYNFSPFLAAPPVGPHVRTGFPDGGLLSELLLHAGLPSYEIATGLSQIDSNSAHLGTWIAGNSKYTFISWTRVPSGSEKADAARIVRTLQGDPANQEPLIDTGATLPNALPVTRILNDDLVIELLTQGEEPFEAYATGISRPYEVPGQATFVPVPGGYACIFWAAAPTSLQVVETDLILRCLHGSLNDPRATESNP